MDQNSKAQHSAGQNEKQRKFAEKEKEKLETKRTTLVVRLTPYYNNLNYYNSQLAIQTDTLKQIENIISRLNEGIEKQQYIIKRSDTELKLFNLEKFEKTLLTRKNQKLLARLKEIDAHIETWIVYIKTLST